MSEQLWDMIRNAKEDLVIQINESAGVMKEGATGIDLARQIFQSAIDKKVEPINHAMSELKKEIQQIF
jgi:DhnA family fructose-bisphosphate aldolase class Ia